MGKFDGILIASDLDGTLLYDAKVSPENREAIKYFMECGGKFTIATGRAPEFVKRLDIPTNAPLILVNGTLVYDSEKIIKSYTFPAEMISVVPEVMESFKVVRVSVFSPAENFIPEPKPEYFINHIKPINKIVFVFEDAETAVNAREYLKGKYSPEYVFERSWPEGVEMRSAYGGKGECLSFIKEYTGVKTVIGAGDWENDRSLLESADISYAPTNAHPEILKLADKVLVHHKDHLIKHIVEDIEKGLDV